MAHRIRYSLQQPYESLIDGVVEADETYIGGRVKGKGRGAYETNKIPVVTLVRRDGIARSQAIAHDL